MSLEYIAEYVVKHRYPNHPDRDPNKWYTYVMTTPTTSLSIAQDQLMRAIEREAKRPVKDRSRKELRIFSRLTTPWEVYEDE